MCGTISPAILLKRDSRSVMRMKPSASMVAMSPVTYQSPSEHRSGQLRILEVPEHPVGAADEQHALLADERTFAGHGIDDCAPAPPAVAVPTAPARPSGMLTATTGDISVQP